MQVLHIWKSEQIRNKKLFHIGSFKRTFVCRLQRDGLYLPPKFSEAELMVQ